MERKRIGIEKYKDICPMRDSKNREGKEGKSCGEEKQLTCQDKREEEKPWISQLPIVQSYCESWGVVFTTTQHIYETL